MVDRINAVYLDDNSAKWLVKNVGAHLLQFGFQKYDPSDSLEELPPGWKMRRVNVVHVSTDGKQARRKSYPVGSPAHDLWAGKATIQVKGPGLDKDGNEVDDLTLTYSVSSTCGEFRTFILETDPGYKSLVANDNITEVKAAEPEGPS